MVAADRELSVENRVSAWRRVRITRGELGRFGNAVLCTCFREHVAKRVHVTEHFVEALGRALKLRTVALAMEHVHRMLDGVELVEELRDRLAQFRCVGSSWRRCEHAKDVGTKVVLFKMLSMFRGLDDGGWGSWLDEVGVDFWGERGCESRDEGGEAAR